MIRRIVLAVLAVLALLALAVAANTWRLGSRQLQVPPLAPITVDERAAAESLAAALRARTVSSESDAGLNADQFQILQAHLTARYPLLHAALQREVVNGLSLLYTWPGSDAKAEGIGLMAHQDVVPIAAGTEAAWQAEPFAGTIRDGFVWGRGAWDDKSNLIAQMEAVEALLRSGFKPVRTVYLIFGADEEVGGERGAARIAALLKERGVRLQFIVDEGLLITDGIMPGLKQPAALVGIAEKGYLSLQLRAKATPGHSSMPPATPGRSAIAQVSAALTQLDAHPMPAAIGGVAAEMFDTIAPEMSGFGRVALSNLWLFGPVVRSQLEQGAGTNAMLRTTTALTMVSAGNKDNVLPGRAEATVNFRILPGDTRASVTEHVRRTIANAEIGLEPLPGSSEPSAVASTRSDAYLSISRTLREVAPDVLVAPALMLGGTDSRWFEPVAQSIFKFSPIRANADDLERFHGTNERVSVAGLAEMIRFYHRLLQQSAGR